jgi:hypothetical protein
MEIWCLVVDLIGRSGEASLTLVLLVALDLVLGALPVDEEPVLADQAAVLDTAPARAAELVSVVPERLVLDTELARVVVPAALRAAVQVTVAPELVALDMEPV